MGVMKRFAASHVLDKHPTCGKLHGHTFKVKVVVSGDPDPDLFNFVVNYAEFEKRIADLLIELDGRHLNDMLPGVIPSAQGLANWFWERLALHYQLDEVIVWQDDLEASLRRE
jgi:6-pyruvoyltetrahydropterin/6-carboxytetrahydropterin synthase